MRGKGKGTYNGILNGRHSARKAIEMLVLLDFQDAVLVNLCAFLHIYLHEYRVEFWKLSQSNMSCIRLGGRTGGI